MLSRRVAVATVPLLLGALWSSAPGHDDLDQAIAVLDQRLAVEPRAADFLARGELRRLDHDFAGALADYHRAEHLGASPTSVALCRADLFLDQGRSREALRTLEGLPEASEAWALRYRALVALGRPREALNALDRSLALDPRPTADRYLERTLRARDLGLHDPIAALHVLDEGLARLGPDPALVFAAVDLELAAGKPGLAVARLEAAARASMSPVPFLVRETEILLASGHPESAAASLRSARERLRLLPESRRRTPLVMELEVGLGKAQAQMELKE